MRRLCNAMRAMFAHCGMTKVNALCLTHVAPATRLECVRVNDPAAVDALLAEMPEVLTIDEIATLFRVSKNTVLKWQHEGLKMLTLGERIRRVRKIDLREFLLHADDVEESDD